MLTWLSFLLREGTCAGAARHSLTESTT